MAVELQHYQEDPGEDYPRDLFEYDVDHFWALGFLPVQYCRCRSELALTLHELGMTNSSNYALELSLEHFLDLLWSCYGDSPHSLLKVPAIYIKLGRMQEAYDFLKWSNTKFLEKDYQKVFVNFKYGGKWPDFYTAKQDVFEDLKVANYDHEMEMFLLKYKLLIDCKENLYNEKNLYFSFLLGVGDQGSLLFLLCGVPHVWKKI